MTDEKKKTLKQIVRKFIQNEGIIIKDIPKNFNPKIVAWRFAFHHPPKSGPIFQITKVKNKNFMVLATKMGIHPDAVKLIRENNTEHMIYHLWKQILLTAIVDYNINVKTMSADLFLRLYLHDGIVSEETFYFSLRKIFFLGLQLINVANQLAGLQSNNNGNLQPSTLYS